MNKAEVRMSLVNTISYSTIHQTKVADRVLGTLISAVLHLQFNPHYQVFNPHY